MAARIVAGLVLWCTGWSVQGAAQEGIAMPGGVTVLGAVRRAGAASMPAPPTVDALLDAVGGLEPQAYRFATLLLRPAGGAPPRFVCVSPGARHAALLIENDPVLRSEQAVVSGLLSGTIERLPALAPPFGRLGSDRSGATLLQPGDLLAVPQRTAQVYVVLRDGRVNVLSHRPERSAADYLAEGPADRLARPRDYVLHTPEGHVTVLAVEGWNAQPTAVPPGSMLAPVATCLPVPQ
ncbi:MAG: hypothetical protein ACPHN2_04115 [Sinimarinibacterium flocculans]|uniref:hypothetical protein n=1 Tax=Sinimarinibacterium flocculans TaxID=985250 RepID=UPI003C5C0CB8